MRTKASTGKIRRTYEFIKANRNRFDVRTMCRVLEVAPSGYYAWLQEPVCQRALEDVAPLAGDRAAHRQAEDATWQRPGQGPLGGRADDQLAQGAAPVASAPAAGDMLPSACAKCST